MKTLYIVRGLPGSGKTTWAKDMAFNIEFRTGKTPAHFEADTYHIRDGQYQWKPENVGAAHEWCQGMTKTAMVIGTQDIFVSNTFTTKKEMAFYKEIAIAYGYRVIEVSLFDGGLDDLRLFERNLHSVPLETIQKMRERWEC